MIRVNLLGVAKAKRRRVRAPMITPGSGMMMGLFIGVLVAVAAVQWFRYGALQRESASLDQQVQTLEREKAELAQVQSQYETFSRRKELLQARINIIEQLKAQQSGPVILLNTVANAVSASDQLWLTNFQKTGDRVTVTGVALNMRAVADLMTRLIASTNFTTVDLRETVQATAQQGQNFNFTIEAQMTPATPPPAPAGAA
jgi:type IV pilus assembly protein PilN